MRALFLIFFFLISVKLNAETPEHYKKVDQILWVVNDLDKTLDGLRNIGFGQVYPIGPFQITNQQYKNQQTTISGQSALARMGQANITWVEPAQGENAFYHFLQKQGEGPFSLMHRFQDLDAMNKEIERLNQLGIATLQKGSFYTEAGTVTMAFMDTREQGKYVLGFIHGPNLHSPELTQLYDHTPLQAKFTQYAFAIEEPGPVSDFWQKIGLPEMKVTHTDVHDKVYYGEKADFDMDLGWQRHGTIVYEWCIPKKGPTVYADHINEHGEGIQHLGFNVPDIDQAIQEFEDKGYKISQSGGWGEKGKPGSGRFAYVNLDEIGGMTIELLWSYKED